MARAAAAIGLAWLGYPNKAERWLRVVREEATAHNYLESQVAAGFGLFGVVMAYRACSPEQLPELQTAIRTAKLAGSPLLGMALNNVLYAGSRSGAWKESVDAYRSVTLYIERFTPSFADINAGYASAPIALLHGSGSVDEALALANATLASAKKKNQGMAEQLVSDSSAEAVAATGDVQGAIRRLEHSLSLAIKAGAMSTRDVFRLLPRLYLQENPADRAAQRKAASVIKQGRRFIKKGQEDKRPLVELSEAILFEARGKRQDADARFAQALQTAREQGARFYVYDILLQRGLARTKRGESAQAKHDLEEARSLALGCEDKYVTKLCDDALIGLTESRRFCA
jgi:hypothetical protein